jgi:hypothetical protein
MIYNTVYLAQEPLWNKNGSRTHEHWIQIEKGINRFVYSFGDERGMIESKVADNLDILLRKAQEEIEFFGMKIETDLTNNKEREKEIVQFT